MGKKKKDKPSVTARVTREPELLPRGMQEEEYLRSMLAHLQRHYQTQARPIIERLAQIEAAKPVIMHLDLSQIEARVLAHLQQKDPLPEEPVKDAET